MKLWQLHAALALAVAVTLGAFIHFGKPSQQASATCRAHGLDVFELDACAALGR